MANKDFQNCSLLRMKTKCNFAPKRLVLHIKFQKFSRAVTPAPVLWERATPYRGGGSTPVRHRPSLAPRSMCGTVQYCALSERADRPIVRRHSTFKSEQSTDVADLCLAVITLAGACSLPSNKRAT